MRRLLVFVVAMSIAPVVTAAQQPQPAPPVPPPAIATTAPAPQAPRLPVATLQPTPQPGRGQGRGTPPPPPSPPAATVPVQPVQPLRPEPPSSWQNIKIEVAITDSLSTEVQTRKTVSMMVLDGRSGQVRSTGGNSIINVDAAPMIRSDGRIYLHVTLEYQPELTIQQTQQLMKEPGFASRMTMFSESLSLIVVDGKPIVASQSADPRSDRKVTVELTVTVQK